MDTNKNINVIVINGGAMTGKDTFIDFCKDTDPIFVESISTVDLAKELATRAGWDGIKDDISRKGLSDLKDLLTSWLDAPFKEIGKKLDKMKFTCWQYNLEPDRFYLFVHCREPEEIQRIVDTYNAKALLIKRGELVVTSNHADANVNDYNYDFIINNNGSLEELRDKAKLFMDALRTKNKLSLLWSSHKSK